MLAHPWSPAYTYGASNYFVDVVFESSGAAISVLGRCPASGTAAAPVTTTISESFSRPIEPSVSTTVKQGTTPIAGTVALWASATTLTFTPDTQLPADADITTTVTGVASTSGAPLPPDRWTFHTESVNDSSAIEPTAAFTPSVHGAVTAIKFYRGTGNTGTHKGSIWSAAGALLGTATFSGESASGWQTAVLTTPVSLVAGQTYVVSYYAPKGHYSATSAFFAAPWTAGPLTAPATNNGRYRYATGGGFPTSSWNASGYFVDVVFR